MSRLSPGQQYRADLAAARSRFFASATSDDLRYYTWYLGRRERPFMGPTPNFLKWDAECREAYARLCEEEER